MDVDLRSLEQFVAVAEELSFTRAAARLQMAQPPLSQSIAKLERRLGVRLFERGSRQVSLTTAGDVLLSEARVVLRRADEAARIVGRTEGKWPLRIGSIPSALSGVLPAVIPAFRARHTDVLPLIYEMEERDQLDALRRRDLDIGVCRLNFHPPDLSVTRLPDERLICALHESHPLAGRRRVRLAELRDEDFVNFPRANAPVANDAVISACAASGFTPRIVHEVAGDQALLSLVACDLAVALVPSATAGMQMAHVVFRPLYEEYAVTPLAAVLPAHDNTPAATGLRDHLAEWTPRDA